MIFFLAGQASAYTHEQQTTLDGMNLSYQLGMAYEKAIQERNVADYNNLVDIYNAWIRHIFGEGAAALFKSKITVADLPVAQKQPVTTEYPYYPAGTPLEYPYYPAEILPGYPSYQVAAPLEYPYYPAEILPGYPSYQVAAPLGAINPYLTRRPFNASSELGKFGKQQVRTDLLGDAEYIEAITADRVLRDFLYPP